MHVINNEWINCQISCHIVEYCILVYTHVFYTYNRFCSVYISPHSIQCNVAYSVLRFKESWLLYQYCHKYLLTISSQVLGFIVCSRFYLKNVKSSRHLSTTQVILEKLKFVQYQKQRFLYICGLNTLVNKVKENKFENYLNLKGHIHVILTRRNSIWNIYPT